MGITYLTVDQVVEFHKEVLTLGGAEGLTSLHLLASAVFSPQQSAFGEDAYPTVAEKAAAYGYLIMMNHAFVDGNKRTGLLAMTTFLDLNGYELVEGEDAIARMFEDAAAGVVDQGEFFNWVIDHARPKSESNVTRFSDAPRK
jgi:death-on-curing protein